MNGWTLRRQYLLGFGAVAVVTLMLLLGIRFLGKTARFHYIEREHLAAISRVDRAFAVLRSGGSAAGLSTRAQLLENLLAAQAIESSVPEELTPPEIALFRLLGFAELVDMPATGLPYTGRIRTLLAARSTPEVTKEEADQAADDMAWLARTAERFGPLVAEATVFVKRVVLGVDLAAVGLVLAVLALLRRSTLVPLERAQQAAQVIARGDLSKAELPTSSDEVGQLSAAINAIRRNISGVVGEVRERTQAVAHSMEEVASGSTDLSMRTEQQASALEQTLASIGQLNQNVRRIGEQVHQADDRAAQAGRVAEAGGQAVGEVVARMQQILESTRRIADINGVVNGIAFQTNILALNAAVEAARAGEQGRGFAVVATEVRSLAHRSADAAREIAALIGGTTQDVEHGVAAVHQAGETIQSVVQSVQQVSRLVNEVAAQLAAQQNGLDQIDQAMDHLDSTTQQNAAVAEQSMSAAQSVRDQAQGLVQAVDRFRLGGADAPAA